MNQLRKGQIQISNIIIDEVKCEQKIIYLIFLYNRFFQADDNKLVRYMQAMETVHLIAKERQGFKESEKRDRYSDRWRKTDAVTKRERKMRRQIEKNI
jgi:hypothetical protein